MKFIDFCAGIGGGRLGLSKLGYECIALSEIDNHAIHAYKIMHETDEINYGDITQIESDFLKDFDLLIGGFPCQTFSIVGTRCGLADEDKGQIIYHLCRILEEKETKYFILENVKGLINHDKGRTLKIIINILNEAGYEVYTKVLNSLDFNIPHMRERVYFVGIRKDIDRIKSFDFPATKNVEMDIREYLIDDRSDYIFDKNSKTFSTFIKYLNNKYNKDKFDYKELLSQEYLILDTRQSDLRLYKNKVPTIRKGRQGLLYVKDKKLRKLSGFEALLLQGFPLEIALKVKDKVSNTQLLGLAGNAMTVNVIEEIAKSLKHYIEANQEVKSMDFIKKGSKTAKDGFKNEQYVVNEFNAYKSSKFAKAWLIKMNYDIHEIEHVKAYKVKGNYKADIQVCVEIKVKNLKDIQNLQVKLVSNPKGFNQIDKRWLKSYKQLWNIPNETYELLQYFTGELPPKTDEVKDKRRMFLTEFTHEQQKKIIEFFKENQIQIVSDILKGRGKFAAEWMLVILKHDEKIDWALEPMNYVLNYFGNGSITITPRGSLAIGKITMQRKGGDGGRDTANMLQFKINPAQLVNKG